MCVTRTKHVCDRAEHVCDRTEHEIVCDRIKLFQQKSKENWKMLIVQFSDYLPLIEVVEISMF